MKHAFRTTPGFTLLEILVALAIISIVMLATLHAGGSATHNAEYLKMRTFAHWVAMNKAAEQQISREWVSIEEKKGEEVMAEKRWYWRMTGLETPNSDVRRVDIAVWADDHRDADPLATIELYIGRPQ